MFTSYIIQCLQVTLFNVYMLHYSMLQVPLLNVYMFHYSMFTSYTIQCLQVNVNVTLLNVTFAGEHRAPAIGLNEIQGATFPILYG